MTSPESGTVAMTSSVEGSSTSKVLPERAGTNLPSTYWRQAFGAVTAGPPGR